MHSFQPSRGRIFFEVFCALTIAGSCAGAWSQTGAWAFLPAAAVSLLYGLIRMFDLAGLRPMTVAEPNQAAMAEEAVELPKAAELQSSPAEMVAEAPLAEPEEPVPVKARKPKAARKSSSRKASSSTPDPVVEFLPVEEAMAPDFVAEVPEPAMIDAEEAEEEADFSDAEPEEAFHAPVAPLFEPEPFVRQQQRAVFGRKAG